MTLDSLFQMLMSMVWAVALFMVILLIAALMTWGERKLASMIQDRIGPNRANVMEFADAFAFTKGLRGLFGGRLTLFGLFHIMADPLKLFFKEDFIPAGANKLIHTLAPILCLFIPLIVFVAVPFAGPLHIQWKDIPAEQIPLIGSWFEGDALHLSDYYLKFVVSDLDAGMLFVFAISSLAVYGVITAGYASNNKFSFLGALRGANQMISYEVALGLTAVGIFLIYGSLNLSEIVAGQSVIYKWGIVTQPVAFVLFLTCGMAEIKRIPFDLPEGESEIVAGYFTEYSSLKFTMFLFGEYVEMILLAAIITTLFFGGWQLGFDLGAYLDGWWAPYLITLLQAGKFLVTTVIWVYLIFMIRWTFPRFRYDQIMRMGWKMVLPLALLNVAVTAVVLAFARGWFNA